MPATLLKQYNSNIVYATNTNKMGLSKVNIPMIVPDIHNSNSLVPIMSHPLNKRFSICFPIGYRFLRKAFFACRFGNGNSFPFDHPWIKRLGQRCNSYRKKNPGRHRLFSQPAESALLPMRRVPWQLPFSSLQKFWMSAHPKHL